MWAILDKDDKTVVDGIPPTYTEEQALDIARGRKLIKLTLENSPAYLQGEWDGVKFHPPLEWQNEPEAKHLFGEK